MLAASLDGFFCFSGSLLRANTNIVFFLFDIDIFVANKFLSFFLFPVLFGNAPPRLALKCFQYKHH